MTNTATTTTAPEVSVKIPDKIYEIAALIKEDWKKVNYAAKPYLSAMFELTTIEDNYVAESARSVINGFLGNATSWKGNVARAVKKKLKEMAK
jgi:hypothetical protein